MVSIVIATYNYGHFITDTLNSVLQQTYTDFECLIIDNLSTDKTSEIVQPFLKDERFKYLSFNQHTNVSAARNAGIRMSKGQYLMFLDADDLIEKNKLKASVELLEKDLSTDLVYTDMRYFKDPNKETLYKNYSCDKTNDNSWMPYFSGEGSELAALLLKGNMMVISSPLFRSSIIKEAGPFNQTVPYNEDWELWMRMALNNKRFKFLDAPDTKAIIRIHQSSLSRDVFKMQLYGLLVLLKHKSKYRAIGLGDAIGKRVQEHVNAIKRSLANSTLQELKLRVEVLKNNKVHRPIVGKSNMPLHVLKYWLKLKGLFNA